MVPTHVICRHLEALIEKWERVRDAMRLNCGNPTCEHPQAAREAETVSTVLFQVKVWIEQAEDEAIEKMAHEMGG
jgi:hypothetical protein